MFHYFKSKTTIKRDSEKAGFKKGYDSAETVWRGHYEELRANKNKIIEKEHVINMKLKDRVDSVEKELENLLDILADAEAVAISREYQANVRHKIEQEKISEQQVGLAEEYKKIQAQTAHIQSLCRRANKVYGRVTKQIEKYRIKSETLR